MVTKNEYRICVIEVVKKATEEGLIRKFNGKSKSFAVASNDNLADFVENLTHILPVKIKVPKSVILKSNPKSVILKSNMPKNNDYKMCPICKIKFYALENSDVIFCGEECKKIWARKLALKNIEIPENQLCQICNERPAGSRHHEDYDKPLDVDFLCVSCHSKLKKSSKNLTSDKPINSIKLNKQEDN